jgi:isocitrate/isopropylmalate dehydrogenase
MASPTVPLPKYRIAVIPGDGIGPDVITAGLYVLERLANTLGTFTFESTHYDWNSETYKQTGKYIPDGGLEELKKHDAILFGAVGAPGMNTLSVHSFINLCARRGNLKISGGHGWAS